MIIFSVIVLCINFRVKVLCLFNNASSKTCENFQYSPNGKYCFDMLTCKDMHLISLKFELPSEGYGKKRYFGLYKEIKVVYSYPYNDVLKRDFLHGINMLLAFQESGFVATVIGYCKTFAELQLVTLYYHYGSADNLKLVLHQKNLDSKSEFKLRTQLSYDYLSIIKYLHNSPLGIMVMCDSNTLAKTLQQYALTDDLRLVVLDLDALPTLIGGTTVLCGHKQLFGEFVAPEQLWTLNEKSFNINEMSGYTEKTDIWKIPNVVKYFLGESSLSLRLQFHLFDLFQLCKSNVALERPNAGLVRKHFQKFVNNLFRDEL